VHIIWPHGSGGKEGMREGGREGGSKNGCCVECKQCCIIHCM